MRLSICLCICVCICLSVCPRAYFWNRWTDLHEFLCRSPVTVARSSSGGVALHYVLPVLWMTSRLAVMGRMALRDRPDRLAGLTVSYMRDGTESNVHECLVVCDWNALTCCTMKKWKDENRKRLFIVRVMLTIFSMAPQRGNFPPLTNCNSLRFIKRTKVALRKHYYVTSVYINYENLKLWPEKIFRRWY